MTGQVCVSGKCGIACPTGQTACGTQCANTMTDGSNCGNCGTVCPSLMACAAGTCVSSCPSGQMACNGSCRNTMIDPSNCGGCGTACMGGLVCISGACTCPTGLTACGTSCFNTASDVQHCGNCATICSQGTVCSGGACVATCNVNESNCAGSCANLQVDPLHCGGCSTTCPAGQTCNAGACGIVCPSGETLCGATCVDTKTDPKNCGNCSNACPAGQNCNSGTCSASCASPLTACSNSCVDTRFDPMNCGSCGKTCSAANGVGGCSTGNCIIASCNTGFRDCNGTATDGCETNLNSDNMNCGSCGLVCTPANGSGGCNGSGKCQITGCNTGFKDCDGNPVNGCEVDLNNDSNNCGACGNKCTGMTCFQGQCNGFVGSTLINSTQGAQINSWIGSSAQIWKLCYRLSTNGSATATFHSLCDNRGPTVTITKTTNGLIFGGYANQSWTSNCQWSNDVNDFLFSISNNYKYVDINGGSNAQYGCNSYGPTFGGNHDFTLAGSGNNIGSNAYCCPGNGYACRVGGNTSPQCSVDFCGGGSCGASLSIQDAEVFSK